MEGEETKPRVWVPGNGVTWLEVANLHAVTVRVVSGNAILHAATADALKTTEEGAITFGNKQAHCRM